ncbi:MAG: MFS transporter [Dehalococcoidia bacterium]
MNPLALSRRRPKIFYGWWMVTLSGFITSLNKTAVNKGSPVFLLPVAEAFGASQAAVNLILSVSKAESGPIGPFSGWLVDRFGPRAMLFVGAIMSGGGFLLLGRAPNLWVFALIYLGLITLGSNIGFSYSMAALMNNWFYRRKALAMSTFHSIDSLVPALLVGVLGLGFALLGLKTASTIIGFILLGTILPLAFFIKNTPESMGLGMDGDSPAGVAVAAPRRPSRRWQPPVDYSVRSAMRTASYWILIGGTAFRLIAKTAIIINLIPIIVSKGVDQTTASFIFGLHLFLTVPMYPVMGWLADRFPKNVVLTVAAIIGALSFVILALSGQSLLAVLAFIFLFSIAEVSAATNWAVVGEYFGRKTFSQLRGYIQFASFPGVLLAPWFVGLWYDHHQSYVVPIWIFTAVFALSALTFAVMRRPRLTASPDAELEPAAYS